MRFYGVESLTVAYFIPVISQDLLDSGLEGYIVVKSIFYPVEGFLNGLGDFVDDFPVIHIASPFLFAHPLSHGGAEIHFQCLGQSVRVLNTL